MYDRILIPLDGSERAERVLPHTQDLARKFGSKLLLLQVVDPFAEVDWADESEPRTLEQKTERMVADFDTLRVIGFAEKEEVVYLLRRKNGTEPAGRPGADIWDRLSLSEFAHLLIEEQKAQEDVRRSQ